MTLRFSILAAVALLVAAGILAVMVGMDRGSPGDVAYASDPGDGRSAVEAEAREARRAALAGRVESGDLTVVQGGGPALTTKAIDLPATQSYCRTVSYNYNDCVTVEIVVDALQGDCTDCRTLDIWIFYNTESGRVTHLSKTDNQFALDFGSLGNMGLVGVIPPEIGDLTGLEDFSVSNNSNFFIYHGPPNQLTGTIPSQIGKLSNLTSLWMYSNQLTGSIPPELGNLSSLTHLALSSNQLTGAIPSELGKLTNLEYLSIDNNQLTGCVPASLREAYEEASGDDYPICQASPPTATPSAPATPTPAATPADCTSNTALAADCETLLGLKKALRGSASLNWWTGRSIEQWDGITVQGGRVTGLSLPNRSLDGILPAGLGSLSALTTLDLSGNSLTGQIPEELNNLGNLTRWRLAGNNLSGCVPSVFARVSDNDAASLGLPTCGGMGPAPTPVPTATPTPPPATPTPTPTPTADVDGTTTLLAEGHCTQADLTQTLGGTYTRVDFVPLEKYEQNGWGLYAFSKSEWVRDDDEDKTVYCLTVLYDNAFSAVLDTSYDRMRQLVEGDLDVLGQSKASQLPEIGHDFQALHIQLGNADVDGDRWINENELDAVPIGGTTIAMLQRGSLAAFVGESSWGPEYADRRPPPVDGVVEISGLIDARLLALTEMGNASAKSLSAEGLQKADALSGAPTSSRRE